jgi:hypothetical protein
LIDAATNATVAAGMITGAAETSARAPLAGISWRIENGALVLTSEEGFRIGAARSAETADLEDAEALEALRHLLRRLRIHPFENEGAVEASWEI